ncbi:MAG TPA: DUF2339 domain-containing protein [Pyrinomonadaceae bacterium]|nr:DUF2339 domain-containing protein [Pyrinomonadaceae bacterium]
MAGDDSSREIIEQLVARLGSLERELRANAERLSAVERRLGVEPRPPEERHVPREPPRPAPPAGEERHVHVPLSPPRPRGGDADGAAARTTPAAAGRDLESVIGGRAFAWAGIIAVAFAAAFFLKLAFESGYIGPTTRVLIGAGAGLVLLGAGEVLRGRGLRHYAFVLSGGGVLILYLSIYAAFNFYQLLSQPAAFALMAGVTAAAVSLSVRLDALPVAVLGLVGGFLTPLLLSTGRDNQVALFTYVALLDAGVLAVAYFKRWRSLNFLSFAATVLVTLGWAVVHYDREKLWPTLFFLSLFFALYGLLAVAHNLLPRRPARWYDLLLAGANATFYFSLSYLLLVDAGYDTAAPASHALLVSAAYAGLFYAVHRLHRADRLLAYGFMGAAVTFFTAAVAIRLELHWVTIVWAVEGLMLTWAGLRAGEPAVRRAALPVFVAAASHWLLFDMTEFAFDAGQEFVPVFNRRALSCAVLVGSMAAAARLHNRADGLGETERAGATTLLALAANGLALVLLTQDLNDYFERRQALAAGGGGARGEYFYGDRLDNARQFSLTALWTIYGATTLAFGARRGAAWARFVGLGLLAVAALKAATLDILFYAAPWHAPVFNQTFTGFALVVAACAFAARLYEKSERVGERERALAPVLVASAHVLAVVALSAEASGYFSSRMRAGEAAGDLELARQLSLSVVWALYGGALFAAGRVRRSRLLRVMALALLGLTTLKVFFWDLSSLDRAYRIVSFVVLGLILLAVSYLYQRSQQQQQRAAPEAGGGAPDVT